jgi:hypothetical protein
VCRAAAGRSGQQQPVGRLVREGSDLLDDLTVALAASRIATPSLGLEVGEGQPRERAEVAESLQPGTAPRLQLLGPTGTGDRPPEVRVPGRDVVAEIAGSAATWAGLRFVGGEISVG